MGTEYERSVFLAALPILLATRYVFFVSLGVYRRVWRFATARDAVPIAVGCAGSAVVAYLVLVALRPIGSFPAVEIFVVDAVLCTLLVGASRLTLQAAARGAARRRHRRRVLVVGAGAAGRGLARELRESHEARVVGFLDDNPRVRRRRILGITVVGMMDEAERAIASTRAEEVLVTIPDAPQRAPRRGRAGGGRRGHPVSHRSPQDASSRRPSPSRPRSRELHARRREPVAPRSLRPLPGGDTAR